MQEYLPETTQLIHNLTSAYNNILFFLPPKETPLFIGIFQRTLIFYQKSADSLLHIINPNYENQQFDLMGLKSQTDIANKEDIEAIGDYFRKSFK